MNELGDFVLDCCDLVFVLDGHEEWEGYGAQWGVLLGYKRCIYAEGFP